MKEYKLYRNSCETFNQQAHYVPNKENVPYYATVAEAIEINKTSISVMTEGCESAVLLDFSDSRERENSERTPIPCPYGDETGEVSKFYITFTNSSPWDGDGSEMVEVKDNAEAHKLLRLLEKHYGIPNQFKGKN